MASLIDFLNFILAIGGVFLLCCSAILLYDIFSKTKTLEKLVAKFGLWTAFAFSASGVVMTLVYSEIFGFVPCGLCWFQRIFLYPQAIILAVAIYTKDRNVMKYGIALSIPGVIVSLYQHYLQMGGTEFVTCPVTNIDCAERILFEFGFMTFPLLSASLFLFLIALYIYLAKLK
jgi:disulfide bond formation protein DsbB